VILISAPSARVGLPGLYEPPLWMPEGRSGLDRNRRPSDRGVSAWCHVSRDALLRDAAFDDQRAVIGERKLRLPRKAKPHAARTTLSSQV
jgi:hypothetical protein